MSLPRSASLCLWLNATLRGSVAPDDFAAVVQEDDPQHLVIGWPGIDEPVPLFRLPGLVRSLGEPGACLALPVAGDPLGLAGPPAFNADALDAGEAVILGGRTGAVGLVPGLDARTVLWSASYAEPPVRLDPGEAAGTLRRTLLSATADLVRLDVASWQPEIPDLLLNLSTRPGLALPPDLSSGAVESVERAVLCHEISALARAEDGGAVSAFEIEARSRCLTDLDVAARRALVAFCSASLGAS